MGFNKDALAYKIKSKQTYEVFFNRVGDSLKADTVLVTKFEYSKDGLLMKFDEYNPSCFDSTKSQRQCRNLIEFQYNNNGFLVGSNGSRGGAIFGGAPTKSSDSSKVTICEYFTSGTLTKKIEYKTIWFTNFEEKSTKNIGFCDSFTDTTFFEYQNGKIMKSYSSDLKSQTLYYYYLSNNLLYKIEHLYSNELRRIEYTNYKFYN